MKVSVEVACPVCKWQSDLELEFPPEMNDLDAQSIWQELEKQHGLSGCPKPNCRSQTIHLGRVQL